MDKIKERIKYIESQLGAMGRLDGWVVQGLKEELEKLKIKVKQNIKKLYN